MKWIQKVTWNDVRNQIKNINPVLYDIIEKINPSSQYALYKIRYPYGQDITQNGRLFIPNDAGTFNLLDAKETPPEIRAHLDYAPTPLIMQLQKQSEIYFNLLHKTVPLDVFVPGDLYGLFEAISVLTHTPVFPTWHVSSGVRSTFLLPNISNQTFHTKMQKKLGYNIPFPHTLADHWDVFRTIIQKSISPTEWHSEILVFSKYWLDPSNQSAEWLKFQNHLLISSWQQANYRLKRIETVKLWEDFCSYNTLVNIPSPLLEIVKHLLAIAKGYIPGFIPVLNENEALPSQIIESAYSEAYGLKNTYPTIIVPYRLKKGNDRPVYFSLAHATLLSEYFQYEHPRNILDDLYNVNTLINCIKKYVESVDALAALPKCDFQLYHVKGDNKQVLNLSEIITNDPILSVIYADLSKIQLPLGAKFLTGCIRIMRLT